VFGDAVYDRLAQLRKEKEKPPPSPDGTVLKLPVPWMFVDPFDAPEYTYVEWANVDQELLVKIMKSSTVEFQPADFLPARIDVDQMSFPPAWV